MTWFKFNLVIVLILFLFSESKSSEGKNRKKKKLSGFIVGRIGPNSHLELTRLNGKYYPSEAVKLCETDLECSGFTYLGAKGVSQLFDVKFFRFIDQKAFSDAKTAGFWSWTSYRVKRNLVAVFHSSSNLTPEDLDETTIKKVKSIIEKFSVENYVESFKWKLPGKSYTVSLIPDDHRSYSFDLKQNMAKLKSEKTTFITLVSSDYDLDIEAPIAGVKNLCSENNGEGPVGNNQIASPKIECQDISNKEFEAEYLDKKRYIFLFYWTHSIKLVAVLVKT